jgi:hypothetical protein
MPKPDSQTLATVTGLLMAGSHSDHIVTDKIPYYMGIAKAICDQAVVVYPNADAPPPALPAEPVLPPVVPQIVLTAEHITAIASEVAALLRPATPSPSTQA